MQDPRQAGINALNKNSGKPIPRPDGTGATPADERLQSALKASGFTTQSRATGWENPDNPPASWTAETTPGGGVGNVIQGGYFKFDGPNLQTNVDNASGQGTGWETSTQYDNVTAYQVSNSGDIWGNLPTGANGPNWNINGTNVNNLYVPGTFNNSATGAMSLVLPQGSAVVMRPDDFRIRYLGGLDSIFSYLGSQFNNVFQYYWSLAVGDLESRLGMFILPRNIICDGIERGYTPGVDYDLEEREMDFNAREFYCQPKGNLVLTWYGLKPIQDVRVGDLVLTHSGSWTPLLKAGSRIYNGDMYKITVAGYPEPISMTDAHRIWTARLESTVKHPSRKKGLRPSERFNEAAWGWVEADKLQVNDLVSWPIDETVLTDREILSHFTEACGEYAVDEVVSLQKDGTTGYITSTTHGKRPLTPDEVGFVLRPEFWRLVGYWLGEGCLSRSGITLSFAKDEQEYIEDVTTICNDVLGRCATYVDMPTTARLQISCSPYREFFKALYNESTKKAQKKLLPWIERLPLEHQKELLLAYWKSDGCRIVNGKTPNYVIGSVSLDLLSSVQRIASRLGLAGNITTSKTKRQSRAFKDGKTYQEQPYNMIWFGPEFGRTILGTNEVRLRSSARRTWTSDGRFYSKITKIEVQENVIERVYSFTTAHTDSSYTGNVVASHNSWGWMKLRYRPIMQINQINMVFPTGQEILNFPPSWIKPQMLSGQIRLVPPQGALSQVVLGPGGYLVMLMGGMFMDMPALLFVDYVAGMWPVPDVLIHAIAMQTAILLLSTASDSVAQGQIRTSASLEGVINESRVFSEKADVLAFGARVKQYEKEIDRIVSQWLRWAGPPSIMVL